MASVAANAPAMQQSWSISTWKGAPAEGKVQRGQEPEGTPWNRALTQAAMSCSSWAPSSTRHMRWAP